MVPGPSVRSEGRGPQDGHGGEGVAVLRDGDGDGGRRRGDGKKTEEGLSLSEDNGIPVDGGEVDVVVAAGVVGVVQDAEASEGREAEKGRHRKGRDLHVSPSERAADGIRRQIRPRIEQKIAVVVPHGHGGDGELAVEFAATKKLGSALFAAAVVAAKRQTRRRPEVHAVPALPPRVVAAPEKHELTPDLEGRRVVRDVPRRRQHLLLSTPQPLIALTEPHQHLAPARQTLPHEAPSNQRHVPQRLVLLEHTHHHLRAPAAEQREEQNTDPSEHTELLY
mmetsp:Transcript_29757/g.95991  ORF Transcript_29757/g.95991 Transcript_29757/m.95991 type:complete len:279 (+) Transcript_29757:671-1507(+)